MRLPLREYWNLLSTYLAPQRRRVALLTIMLFAGIAAQLVNPLIVRAFIDQATARRPLDSLLTLAVLFLAVGLVAQGLAVVETWIAENVGWMATNELRGDLALHCLRLDLSFHNARTPGELIERVDGDVTALANFFSRFVINILGNLLLMLGALALLFSVNWQVGGALSLFVAVALWTMMRVRAIAVPYWKQVREESAQFFGFIGEQLSGTEDLRSAGAKDFVLRRMAELMRRWLRKQFRSGLAGYSMHASSLILFTTGNAIAFALAAWLFRGGAITIGTAYLIFQYTELLRRPVEQIRTQMQDLQLAGAGIERIKELLSTQAAIVAGHGHSLPDGPLSVEVEQLHFSYNGVDPILRNISFQLAVGKVLGVVGRTGSGKTSLARLLVRLYEPQSGRIRLGGVDVRDANLDDLRQRVGVVTQEVQLFHATTRDNITLFDDAIPEERVLAALRDVGLEEWYGALPNGLETVLDSGHSLSAGQAQLLAFARVLLRDPGLVILDEASSRLDPASEIRLQRTMDTLLAGRTGVVVAHRLATLQHADQILVIEDGRIREHGDRLTLAADPTSRYAELLRAGLELVTI